MLVYKCGDTHPLFLNSRCEVHALKTVPLISEVDDDCCFSKRQIRAKNMFEKSFKIVLKLPTH